MMGQKRYECVVRMVAIPLAAAICTTLIARAAPGDSKPRFSTSTATVVVDVVVRDRQHGPVADLAVEDFEVYEDGVRQTITTFDAIGTATRARSDRSGTASPSTSDDGSEGPPAVIALVFEQLGPEARRIAEHAARALVTARLRRSSFAAVYYLDRAIHPLTPFTNDPVALREGVRQAFLRPGYPLERAGAVPGAEYSSAADAGAPSSATRSDSPFVRAHATFDALERLVESLAPLPGRKAVILFSEGLALMHREDRSIEEEMAALGLSTPSGPGPRSRDRDVWLNDNRREAFFRLFERANQAHVAFYTFDARGLRVESPLAGCPACGPYVGLKMLADETGGAFVDSTNDLVAPVGRVLADLEHYYLLGYTPERATLDDTYREIRVNVRRPDVKVLARKGYRASRRPDSGQVRPYEVAPLLTLNSGSNPSGFPMRVGTIAFPEAARPGRTAIVAQIPGAGLTWKGDSTGRSAGVTVLARVVNDRGETLEYASERFELRASGADETREILFYKEADLQAGVHSLEVAAVDAHSHAATVRRATVEVPKRHAGATPLVSTPFIVRMAERTTGDRLREGALRFGDWLLVPNLGDPVPARSELSFAFAVDGQAHAELKATATLLTDGEAVASAPLELPQPDRDGRILYVGRIPLTSMKSGTHQLGVVVANGAASVQRLVTVQIDPEP